MMGTTGKRTAVVVARHFGKSIFFYDFNEWTKLQ